jgi:hypothetical protein
LSLLVLEVLGRAEGMRRSSSAFEDGLLVLLLLLEALSCDELAVGTVGVAKKNVVGGSFGGHGGFEDVARGEDDDLVGLGKESVSLLVQNAKERATHVADGRKTMGDELAKERKNKSARSN